MLFLHQLLRLFYLLLSVNIGLVWFVFQQAHFQCDIFTTLTTSVVTTYLYSKMQILVFLVMRKNVCAGCFLVIVYILCWSSLCNNTTNLPQLSFGFIVDISPLMDRGQQQISEESLLINLFLFYFKLRIW